MRARASAAAVAASFLVAVSAHAAKPCTFRGAHTIAENSKVRIFKQLSNDHTIVKYESCMKRTNRRFKFDQSASEKARAFDFHLSGYVVGYALNYLDAGGDSSHGYVASYNVRTQRRLRHADAASSPGQFKAIDKLLMTPMGELAWIGDGFATYPGAPPRNYEVHVYGTSDRVVDSGTDIDPRSLTLTGATVTWVRAGMTETATIGS